MASAVLLQVSSVSMHFPSDCKFAIALLGASVVFSDIFGLDQLRENINQNLPEDLHSKVEVCSYAWYHFLAYAN